jgi:hypothetical protein
MREPDAAKQLRDALDAALAATFDFGIRALKDPRWQPSPGSDAARELAAVETGQTGEPWGEDAPRTSYAAASLLRTGVLDNLGSIRQLIGDPMPALGPAVLARSALEIGATAWWLMEPGIGVRARTCRQLVLSLISARRAAQVARELDDPEGRTEGLEQEGSVLRMVSDLAIAAPSGRQFRPILEGEAFQKRLNSPQTCSDPAIQVCPVPSLSTARTQRLRMVTFMGL